MNGNTPKLRVDCWWPLHFPTPIKSDETQSLNEQKGSQQSMTSFFVGKSSEEVTLSILKNFRAQAQYRDMEGDSHTEQSDEDELKGLMQGFQNFH